MEREVRQEGCRRDSANRARQRRRLRVLEAVRHQAGERLNAGFRCRYSSISLSREATSTCTHRKGRMLGQRKQANTQKAYSRVNGKGIGIEKYRVSFLAAMHSHLICLPMACSRLTVGEAAAGSSCVQPSLGNMQARCA